MKFLYFIAWTSLLFSTVSCNKLDKEAAASSGSTSQITVSGIAQLGPIKSAFAIAYLLEADGSRGELLGTTTTDDFGAYSFQLKPNLGNIEIVITAGRYREEAGGALIDLGDTELSVVSGSLTGDAQLSVTPLTHIAAKRAKKLRQTGVEIADAIVAANSEVALASGIVNIHLPPANPEASVGAASEESRKYALFLAGMSKMAEDAGVSSIEVSNAFSNDFQSDGEFDGSDGGSNVILGSSGSYLGNDDWTNDLDQAIDDFVVSGDNTAGFDGTDAVNPIADAHIFIPAPVLAPITPAPTSPIFFALEAPVPMPMGVCVPVNILILDDFMNITDLKTDHIFKNLQAFDPLLAQFYSDSSCLSPENSDVPIPAGTSIFSIFLKTNSPGSLDFHNYIIEPVSPISQILHYMGHNNIIVDPYAPGSLFPQQYAFMGPSSVAMGSCTPYSIEIFDNSGAPVPLHNGGELIQSSPNPSVYEFHMDPACTSPMSSIVPLMPGGPGTNQVYIKAVGGGTIDLNMMQFLSLGVSGTMPLVVQGNSQITVF